MILIEKEFVSEIKKTRSSILNKNPTEIECISFVENISLDSIILKDFIIYAHKNYMHELIEKLLTISKSKHSELLTTTFIDILEITADKAVAKKIIESIDFYYTFDTIFDLMEQGNKIIISCINDVMNNHKCSYRCICSYMSEDRLNDVHASSIIKLSHSKNIFDIFFKMMTNKRKIDNDYMKL